MPIYFVQSSQISGYRIHFSGELAHHLRDVLRIKGGQVLKVVDEQRRRYRVAINRDRSGSFGGVILGVEDPLPTPTLRITLGQALLKRPKMDLLVQKMTELGVTRFQPLLTERTVVRESNGGPERRERWKRIALEAAQQSGRDEIPEIEAPIQFSQWINSKVDADLQLILWEGEHIETLSWNLTFDRPMRSAVLVVGSEGGFSPREMDMARAQGLKAVTLGRRILRAETAAIAGLSILQYELGDMR